MAQKILKPLIVFLLVILLTSCVEMSEEIWINSDTSGRLKIDICISEKIISFAETLKTINNDDSFSSSIPDLGRIEEELLNESNVKNVVVQEYSDSGTRHYLIDLYAEDLHDLPELSGKIFPNSAKRNITKSLFSIKDIGKGVLLFKQDFNGEVKSGKAISKAFLTLVFGDDGISVALYAPHISSSNGQVSDDEKMTTWKIFISDPDSWEKLEAELEYSTS